MVCSAESKYSAAGSAFVALVNIVLKKLVTIERGPFDTVFPSEQQTQNRLKTDAKQTQNRRETDAKKTQNRLKTDAKQTQNRRKTDAKQTQNRVLEVSNSN